MFVTIYFAIRLPDRPYQRSPLKIPKDEFSTLKVENLKKIVARDLLIDGDASRMGELFTVYLKTKNALFY